MLMAAAYEAGVAGSVTAGLGCSTSAPRRRGRLG
jgi:hypothetical protein